MPKLSPKEFYKKYYPIVAKRVNGTGIYPETVMAQMAIETGWGQYAPGNNFFGIKGKGQIQSTKEFKNGKMGTENASFITNNSFEDSLDSYVKLITTSPNYAKSLKAKNAEEQITLIHAGGYATDPNYVSKAKYVWSITNDINKDALYQQKGENSGVNTVNEIMKTVDGTVKSVNSTGNEAFQSNAEKYGKFAGDLKVNSDIVNNSKTTANKEITNANKEIETKTANKIVTESKPEPESKKVTNKKAKTEIISVTYLDPKKNGGGPDSYRIKYKTSDGVEKSYTHSPQKPIFKYDEEGNLYSINQDYYGNFGMRIPSIGSEEFSGVPVDLASKKLTDIPSAEKNKPVTVSENKPIVHSRGLENNKTMSNTRPQLLSEEVTDKGKKIKVKLADGTEKVYNIDKNHEFVPIGNNGYIISNGNQSKAYKIPGDKSGELITINKPANTFIEAKYSKGNASGSGATSTGGKLISESKTINNSVLGKIYKEEAKAIKAKVDSGNFTDADMIALKSIMNLDLLDGDEKDILSKEINNNYVVPIQKKFVENQVTRNKDVIAKNKIKLAQLNPDDPEREKLQQEINEKQDFNNTTANKKIFDIDEVFKTNNTYTDVKTEFDKWSKEVTGLDGNSNYANGQNPDGTSSSGSASVRVSTTTPGTAEAVGGPNTSVVVDEKGIANDMTYTEGGEVIFKNKPTDKEALQKKIDEDKATLDTLKSYKEKEFEYAPDAQPKRDALGYGMDLARVVIGMKGANKELPTYKQTDEFQKYINDATARKDMGMLPQVKDYYQSQNELGYAYDVKNIARLAGGSAGNAMANLGRAANTFQEGNMKIAAQDALMRNQNWSQFATAASANEQINVNQFQNTYNQAMMDKTAGAGLVADALTNIGDRNQFENAYGKGSQMYEYQKYLTENVALDNQALKDASANMRDRSARFIEDEITKNQQELDRANSASVITAEGSDYKPLPEKANEQLYSPESMNEYNSGIINNITSQELSPDGTRIVGQSSMTAMTPEQIASQSKTGPFANGMNVDQIKAMAQKGEPIYSSVVNTPQFTKSKEIITQKLDTQIADLNSQMANSDNEEANLITKAKINSVKEKRKELLDKLVAEQETWADTQFNENDEFIGSGENAPTYDWLNKELGTDTGTNDNSEVIKDSEIPVVNDKTDADIKKSVKDLKKEKDVELDLGLRTDKMDNEIKEKVYQGIIKTDYHKKDIADIIAKKYPKRKEERLLKALDNEVKKRVSEQYEKGWEKN
jgi:hypothetical protein